MGFWSRCSKICRFGVIGGMGSSWRRDNFRLGCLVCIFLPTTREQIR